MLIDWNFTTNKKKSVGEVRIKWVTCFPDFPVIVVALYEQCQRNLYSIILTLEDKSALTIFPQKTVIYSGLLDLGETISSLP